jgi:DNA-binding transcriptional MerR regulator
MLNTRADALREKIERLHRRLQDVSPMAAEQLRELSALSAELAGIEGGGYGERWRRIEEVAAELDVEPRVLRARIREAGIKPARPGRHPMLSDRDVHTLMEASRARGLHGGEPLTEVERAHQRAARRGETRRLLDGVRADWEQARPEKPAGKREADPKAAAVQRRVHELLDKS